MRKICDKTIKIHFIRVIINQESEKKMPVFTKMAFIMSKIQISRFCIFFLYFFKKIEKRKTSNCCFSNGFFNHDKFSLKEYADFMKMTLFR